MKRFIVVAAAALTLLSTSALMPTGTAYAQECVAGAPVNGNDFPNVLNGGPLNNVIRGFAGNDILRGFECNDELHGGKGDDHLNGGPGFDQCFGGPGNDTFANCEVVVQ